MGFYKLLGGKELNEMMVSGECNDVDEGGEDVVFIHGFISSSLFWSETVFPNLSKSCYRLFAVDLLGFGRSPKPNSSLYTLREHLEMIERSVLEAHKVKSFHIVAHSLGCILALALAVKHPQSVKSLTLLAPVINHLHLHLHLHFCLKGIFIYLYDFILNSPSIRCQRVKHRLLSML